MTKSKFRGHAIEYLNDQWVFSDTKESTAATWESRTCGHCEMHNTEEGHDACLGALPGVMNACCGHGQTNATYVQLLDGHCIHGVDAVMMQGILKQ